MRGNNYTKASPGSAGQTTNDKRPLGINLESALLHCKQNHNLSPATTTPLPVQILAVGYSGSFGGHVCNYRQVEHMPKQKCC